MKILIVDNHPLFREGVKRAIEESSLRAEVLNAASLLEALALLNGSSGIRLVLLDIHLRRDDGIQAMKAIRKRHPNIDCILTAEDDCLAGRAIAAGASGVVLKSFTATQLITAIERVIEGDVFTPTLSYDAYPDDPALTSRQLEVVNMLGRGFSNKEIARQLDVAERTVKAHMSAVFEALNVRNRTQAVLAAQQRGFLHSVPTPHYAADARDLQA